MNRNTGSRKNPQLAIPLDRISLDLENPRLSEENQNRTELDTLKALVQSFNLDEIAHSMVENGYFKEEPIVVVPYNLDRSFKWNRDSDIIEEDLKKLIDRGKIKFIVVEGNRRIATAKILLDTKLKQKLGVANWPQIKNKDIKDDLSTIPSIIYKTRKEVFPYLGVRHIVGIKKWDAFAKARYIAQRLKRGTDIKEVQDQVGDTSNSIRRQFYAYKVVRQAENSIGYDIENIKNRFSLLVLALGQSSIREFLNAPPFRKANLSKPLIPKTKLNNLKLLLTWIYGSTDKPPVLTDSRKITGLLSPVLASVEATEYLKRYNNLEEAYEYSEGEKEYILKQIRTANKSLKNSLRVAFKFKRDKNILSLIDECLETAEEVRNTIKSVKQ